MSRRDSGISHHGTPHAAAASTTTPPKGQLAVPLGEYMRMSPNTLLKQGVPMRTMSAGRVNKASASSTSLPAVVGEKVLENKTPERMLAEPTELESTEKFKHGAPTRSLSACQLNKALVSNATPTMDAEEKILEPLPPPSLQAEAAAFDSVEQQILSEDHRQLLAAHRDEKCSPLPAQLNWLHSLASTSSQSTMARSIVKADAESRMEMGSSELWATLDPFDSTSNPSLLKKGSVNQKSRHRSPSSSRERLEQFKPSFRTDWLIALRQALLDGVKEEAVHLRRDFAEAVGDMRADFWDAMSGTLDASGVPRKPRTVDVNLKPVLQEIQKRKEELDQTIKTLRAEFNFAPVLSAVKEVKEEVRKEQTALKTEVAKICKSSSGNLVKEMTKISERLLANQVNSQPTLANKSVHASQKVLGLPQVDPDGVAAIKEINFGPVLDAVTPPLRELVQLSAELKMELAGLDTKLVKLDTKQDAWVGQMDAALEQLDTKLSEHTKMECAETGTATLEVANTDLAGTDISTTSPTEVAKTDLSPVLQELATIREIVIASQEATNMINLSKLEEQIAGSQQELSRAISAQLGKTGEIMTNPNVDFAPVLAATSEILQEVRASAVDLQPVLHAVTKINYMDDFHRVFEAVERVDSKQDTQNQGLEKALGLLRQIDAKPPFDDSGLQRGLLPVLDAIAAIDVQPVLPVDEVMAPSKDMKQDGERKTLFDGITAESKDIEQKQALDGVMAALKDIEHKQRVCFESIAGTMSKIQEHDLRRLVEGFRGLNEGLTAARGQSEVLSAVHGQVEALRTISEATGESVARIDTGVVTEMVREVAKQQELLREVAKRQETGLQWVVHFMAGLEVQPRINLQPILEAISKINLGVGTERVDLSQAAAMESLQVAAVKRDTAIDSLLAASAKGEAATAEVLEVLKRSESHSQTRHENLLERQSTTDTILRDQFMSLEDQLGQIDVSPSVDMQPVVDEIAKSKVNSPPAVQRRSWRWPSLRGSSVRNSTHSAATQAATQSG